MSFYLGVWKWNSPTAASDDDAAAQYLALSAEKSVAPEFDANGYPLYCGPADLMVPKDELRAYPRVCGIDISGDHVNMAIHLEKSEKGEARQ